MEKPSASVYVGCMNVLNTITQLLMGGAGFFGIALGDLVPLKKLNIHSILTAIGLTILCSQAILLVNPYKGFNDNFKFPKKTKFYWIIQIIGCVLVLAGACLGIAMISEGLSGILNQGKHLQTSHGITGFIVMLLVSVKLVGAIVNLIFADRLSNFMKILYVIVSIVTIVMGYISVCIKYGDVNVSNFSSPAWAISFSVLTMVSLLLMSGARVLMTGSIKF
ncbi:unnamed protein product [Spodoptera exigua]|uniref:Cytochrome b561 domain-containing protein n=1 Tax=Spodoptera exigua TaxID=7107 RepID=A0A922MQT7_SPOEX|nr:hypothetical protein HF086_013031 [Spodoptera exigua]CAH0695872.1 unnamed protein product [Spodoptera exigua]